MERVVIIGAGAHGREVLAILRQQAQTQSDLLPLGYLDEDSNLKGQTLDGLAILGAWDWFDSVDRREVAVICASGFSEVRKHMTDRANAIGLRFVKAISPAANVSQSAVIGDGVVIYPNGMAARGTVLGDHSIINMGAIVSHDTKLGSYATLNPGVNLAGDISIGEGCYLGIGCSVIQGINIGPWTTVGAGAAVISDLPANVTAVGVPARVIKTREKGWHEQFTSAAGH
jgi:sugar O-acyltransferase (sialic acid O-acetyltransferase NeuD family)